MSIDAPLQARPAASPPVRTIATNRTWRLRAAALLVLFTLVGVPAMAAKSKVNSTLIGNVAIDGYDPVAYFESGGPTKGSRKLTVEWQGANWRFSSQENLDAFEADPERYAPQYGGYCAWAVSQGSTAGIDPNAWKIVDGRLYLNYNKKIQEKWEADQDNLIEKADQNWPTVLDN